MPKVIRQQGVTVTHTTTGGKPRPGTSQDEKIVRGEHRMTTGGKPYTVKKEEEGEE
jgi:hypothetical protein